MSQTYSIRIRGRVHGPFNLAKLRELARKGQLGRMHELSPDGQTWAPASTVPEIFQGGEPAPATRAAAAPAQPTASSQPAAEADAGEWFYSTGGGSEGPHTFEELKRLAANGRLGAGDNVWHPGREEWIEAGDIPSFHFRNGSSERSREAGAATAHEASELAQVAAALGAANGWKLFIAITLLVVGVLGAVGGLLLLSTVNREPAEIAVAVLAICNNVFIAAMGASLLNAHSKLSTASAAPSNALFITALRAEGQFWFLAGLGLLLVLLLIVLVMVVSGTQLSSLRG